MVVLRTVCKMERFPPPFALSYSSLQTNRRVAMTSTVTELLARKQQLLERLQGELPGLDEQDEIERLLANINAMLNRLDAEPIEARATRH
jgi:hypothetical protein